MQRAQGLTFVSSLECGERTTLACAKKAAIVSAMTNTSDAPREQTHSKFLIFAASLCLSLLSACATDDGTRLGSEPPYPYETSNADPASYGADGFSFNKRMKVRDPNEFMFYYKRCTLTGDRSYYSKTEYFCTEP